MDLEAWLGFAQKPWDGSSQLCRGFGVLFSVCTQHSIVQGMGNLFIQSTGDLGPGDGDDVRQDRGPCGSGGSVRDHTPPAVDAWVGL